MFVVIKTGKKRATWSSFSFAGEKIILPAVFYNEYSVDSWLLLFDELVGVCHWKSIWHTRNGECEDIPICLRFFHVQ